jgi:copper(I)-binding protein
MKRTFVFIAFIWVLVACGPRLLTVEEAWVRPALTGNNSAIYFIIHNPTSEEDTLLGVTSPVAQTVEMHMTTAMEGEHNMEHDVEHDMPQAEVLRMVEQDSVPVPRRSQVEFAPGGLHVMLLGVQTDLSTGDTIQVTLMFEKAGEIVLQVPVEER